MFKNFLYKTSKFPVLSNKVTRKFAIVSNVHPETGPSQVQIYIFGHNKYRET